jgi:hypothetical protein
MQLTTAAVRNSPLIRQAMIASDSSSSNQRCSPKSPYTGTITSTSTSGEGNGLHKKNQPDGENRRADRSQGIFDAGCLITGPR